MTRYLMFSGAGRSGTTVMRRSIGLHPDIYYNDKENNIVQDILSAAHQNCTIQSRKNSMVVDQNVYNEIFRETIERLIWPNVSEIEFKYLMAAINISADLAPYLCEVFPGCKIVYLIRSGIEVVASRMRYRSFSSHTFESHCATWNRSFEMARWGQSNTGFRLFRYEWLVDAARTREELVAIFEWLGLSWNEQPFNQIFSVRFHPTDDDDPTTDVKHSDDSNLEEERRRLHEARAARWKDWTDEQRRAFASICGEGMEQLGYELPWD